MSRLFLLAGPATKRRRGNPNWGKPSLPVPVLLTEFELLVKRLGLTKEEYIESFELKRWCELNRNRVYGPEWLLKAWRMHVEDTFGSVA
jgi:hypothetical protein